jgi:hypothetical protein
LGFLLVVPEARVGHLGVQYAQTSALAIDVKDTSATPSVCLACASDHGCVRFPPFPTLGPLEDFLARAKHFVECFLKVRRTLGQLLAHLRNILFEALFYLLPKELFQSTVAQTFRVLRRMVGDDVRHEGARKTFCALVRVLGQKGIERSTYSRFAAS